MTRRRKYFNAEDAAAAKRLKNAKYDASPRGKTVRAENRALRNTRKVSQFSIPRLRALSYKIENMAAIPLPVGEHLFEAALRSPNTLDESGLGIWKKEPPFEADPDRSDPHSEHSRLYTQNLQIVLHGVRMREQRARDAQRREEFIKIGTKVSLDQLREEVQQLLQDWKRVSALNIYNPIKQPREHSMLQHFIQWQARTIYHLYYVQFLAPCGPS